MKLFTNSHAIIKGLEKINISTSEEVLDHLPYRYEDNSYTDLSYLEDNQSITVYGRLVSNPTKFSNGKFSVIRFFFVTENNSFFKVTMYNRPYVHNTINLGDFYTIIGTYKAKDKEIIVKSFLQNKIPSDKSIRGVYHLPSEITPTNYRKFISNTYDKMVNYIIDDIPSIFKNKYRLLDKKEAYKYVHFPSNEEELKKGLRTLKYHECLAFSLKNQIIRGENKSIPNEDKKLIDTKKINEFVKNLSYKLTSDQIKAIREIILDMNQKSYMYRLLQGDVGTGKTIVAMSALYGNYIRGNIGVFMAPTDSLARQQYKELEDIFKPYGIKVGMLIGGLTVKEKKVITTK